ncbi:TrkA family potassium uptake protein [uncultured Bacteroides sp.]|uniref:potassium channel family protein n=1 Tax=uncultured Bacteroides sp. TaxID=162156 RepID=UPI002AAA9FB0|nr:TrkA family potassium uptake protein [uncultured Bacteroides sp.]
MKYIIIGLGNFGYVLAEELSALGHEVIGVDIVESRVDTIKDKIATGFVLDATDETSLAVLPLNSVDVVIVTIGENFGASVRVTALLKQKQVKHIYARAIDAVHKAVLEAFGLDMILTPEEDSARELVQLLDFGNRIESFRVDQEYFVMMFRIPDKFIDYPVNQLNLNQEFNLKIIGLKRSGKVKNFLGVSVTDCHIVNELLEDEKMQPEDELVCYGKYDDFRTFWKAL